MSGMDLGPIFAKLQQEKADGLAHDAPVYMPGDMMGTTRLNGSKIMFCPFCKVYLPAMFLRLEDKPNEQSMGYSCSKCDAPLVAITRDKMTGKLIKKYTAPGYEFEDHADKNQQQGIKMGF